jgi:hypothetical protein
MRAAVLAQRFGDRRVIDETLTTVELERYADAGIGGVPIRIRPS